MELLRRKKEYEIERDREMVLSKQLWRRIKETKRRERKRTKTKKER
jgi:hypothetical protein